MKLYFKSIFSILIIVGFLMSCQQRNPDSNVVISIDAASQKDSLTLLKVTGLLNYKEKLIIQDTISSYGKAKMVIDLKKPTFGLLKIGANEYNKVYLEPGMKMQVTLNQKNDSFTTEFSGDGAIPNNYLTETAAIWERFYEKNSNCFQLDKIEFASLKDSLSGKLNAFDKIYFEQNNLPDKMKKILVAVNQLGLINLKQQHWLSNMNAYANDSIFTTQNAADIPKENLFLEVKMVEYAKVLDLFHRIETMNFFQLRARDNNPDTEKIIYSEKINNMMDEMPFPDKVKEFLLARNILFWLDSQGVTQDLDTLYSKFKAQFKDSSSVSTTLGIVYNEWHKIAPGQFAPEITGLNLENKTISLSQLKGKIVYIDVWASWCSPCIKEFPHYKGLNEEFTKNKNVEFLFVSVDKDAKDWRAFLENKSTPTGIHIKERHNPLHPSVYESYKIWGIPRNILIDQNGKIVNSNAPGPSSGMVAEMIKSLLH